MEFQELVEKRRSIRNYKENCNISEADVKAIISCALEAPSWKNSQTGRYYVVSSESKLKEISENALPEFNQSNSKNSVALIVTAFEANRSGFNMDGTPTNEIGNEWGAYDLGLQNMLLCLKAKELGYDTLIMGIRDADRLRAELGIPESQHVVSVIALGVAAAEANRPKRKEIGDILKMY